MSKILMGDVCAHIPGAKYGEKGSYRKIGVAFKDSDTGSISIKLDTLPLPGCGWVGWCNIFEEREAKPATIPKELGPPFTPPFPEDDIPF